MKNTIIYHGSNVEVSNPKILINGYYKDFGYGFYCTNIEKQAKRWALTKKGASVVNNYSYLKNPQYHFGYTGLKNVADYVKNYLDIHTKTVKESDITYTCVSSYKDTIKHIYQVLYNNATIYMDRKYETFIKII